MTTPPTDLLPAAVQTLVAAACGAPLTQIAPTSGGFSHRTVSAQLHDAPVVVKAASGPPQRADLRREARILELLAPHTLPVPRLGALIEDDHWTVEVLGYLPGENGIALYANPADPALSAAFTALGGVLARIHRMPVPTDAALLLGPDIDTALTALPAAVPDDALHAPLAHGLRHPAWQQPRALVHGDAGLHNILWDGELRAVLDWEWAGVGSPLLDLAWTRWTMQWREADMHWPALAQGYGGVPVLDLATLDTLALGRIALILQRVAANTVAHREWLRRARWTVEKLSA